MTIHKEFKLKIDSDRLLTLTIYCLLITLVIFILYPLIYTLSASLSDPIDLVNGRVWLLPVDANLRAYQRVFENKDIWLGYRNTVFYTVSGTFINLVLTVMAAYPLSRRDLKGRNLFMIIIVFTMFFDGGLIPRYLVVRGLRMTNTIWAMIIPSAINTYNVIVMRTFFQVTIPEELKDSAFIDGCSNTIFLLKVVLPLSGPILAVMVLFYGVFHWNDFFSALIYISNRKLFPLQLILREILIQSETEVMIGMDAGMLERFMQSEALKYSVIFIASFPMLILYPFLQRFFVKGVMVGAIKG
jgi:putative aldouronate transport system permease protein